MIAFITEQTTHIFIHLATLSH